MINNEAFDITNLPIFKQYYSEPVCLRNRVEPMKQYDYKMVSYKEYVPDEINKPTFLNMRKDKIGN